MQEWRKSPLRRSEGTARKHGAAASLKPIVDGGLRSQKHRPKEEMDTGSMNVLLENERHPPPIPRRPGDWGCHYYKFLNCARQQHCLQTTIQS